ncbi:MAG: MogA/MoaB family molybdenum cofactor biosynthesis protein [Phycisphaerales bacterium]|nr:MAG: MogA/MoaB family molybdenum cofactor biosynthesis protein [Phycisphaerales bacterium]
MTPSDHHQSDAAGPLGYAVLTVSDTRTPQTDASGAAIIELMDAAGHTRVDYRIVRDETQAIRGCVTAWVNDPRCRVVLMTGGTGVASRDVTVEAVEPLFDKRLEGFGELLRQRSFQQVGPAAMLSRATAGVSSGTVIFAMPGSTAAVRLAMTELVLPPLRHLVALVAG